MKKSFVIIAMVLLFLAGFAATGSAYSFSDLYFEDYWEPVGGFDYGTSDFGAGLGAYIGTGSLGNYGDQTVLDFFIASGDFTDVIEASISVTGFDEYAGTWAVSNSNTPQTLTNWVDYIMVKGARTFSIHFYDPSAASGIWNVGYLADAGRSGKPPEMSFVRAYSTTSTTPVPEPTSILLLGFGILSLGISRRITKKK